MVVRNKKIGLSPVSIQTQSLALRCVRCVNENRKKRKRLRWKADKFSRNKRKRQPIGMLGRSSGNHDWLLANASDCVWMETGLYAVQSSLNFKTTCTRIRHRPTSIARYLSLVRLHSLNLWTMSSKWHREFYAWHWQHKQQSRTFCRLPFLNYTLERDRPRTDGRL